jgi:hypothetical protein
VLGTAPLEAGCLGLGCWMPASRPVGRGGAPVPVCPSGDQRDRPGAPGRAEMLPDASALRVDLEAGVWAELKREELLHPAAPVPGAA